MDDLALLARVRALVRYKIVQDELRARALTSAVMGFMPQPTPRHVRGSVLLVEDRPATAAQLISIVRPHHDIIGATDAAHAQALCATSHFDVAMVSLGLTSSDGLRLLSHWRAQEATRAMALIMLAGSDDRARVWRGLDFGVHDYVMRPIDRGELLARLRTQIRHKRDDDQLRYRIDASMRAAMSDALTGVHNRRFFEHHLRLHTEQQQKLALMMLDIDHFKRINDVYGHDGGDDVLRGFAARLHQVTRDMDLLCRLGGEEFAIIMPQTDLAEAVVIAERVRQQIQNDAFVVRDGAHHIPVTVSIGLAASTGEAGVDLYHAADQALYRAKQNGRNQVAAAA
jgi:two-component system cell cycle response regulator